MNTFFRYLFGSTPIGSFWTEAAWAILRVVLGLGLALGHGKDKLPPSDAFIGYLDGIGLPFPTVMAWLTLFAEFVCGLLLALGLITRFSALAILITMTVALLMAHGGQSFSDRELPILYLAATIPFFVGGAGRFSFDRFLKRA